MTMVYLGAKKTPITTHTLEYFFGADWKSYVEHHFSIIEECEFESLTTETIRLSPNNIWVMAALSHPEWSGFQLLTLKNKLNVTDSTIHQYQAWTNDKKLTLYLMQVKHLADSGQETIFDTLLDKAIWEDDSVKFKSLINEIDFRRDGRPLWVIGQSQHLDLSPSNVTSKEIEVSDWIFSIFQKAARKGSIAILNCLSGILHRTEMEFLIVKNHCQVFREAVEGGNIVVMNFLIASANPHKELMFRGTFPSFWRAAFYGNLLMLENFSKILTPNVLEHFIKDSQVPAIQSENPDVLRFFVDKTAHSPIKYQLELMYTLAFAIAERRGYLDNSNYLASFISVFEDNYDDAIVRLPNYHRCVASFMQARLIALQDMKTDFLKKNPQAIFNISEAQAHVYKIILQYLLGSKMDGWQLLLGIPAIQFLCSDMLVRFPLSLASSSLFAKSYPGLDICSIEADALKPDPAPLKFKQYSSPFALPDLFGPAREVLQKNRSLSPGFDC